VRDLVKLLDALYRPPWIRVALSGSADEDFLFPHVGITKVAEPTAEGAKAGGPGPGAGGLIVIAPSHAAGTRKLRQR
jgi:hypothetical protein